MVCVLYPWLPYRGGCFVRQDRLKRQRAVDKMQLAKVEREKQQEMEQVRAWVGGWVGG